MDGSINDQAFNPNGGASHPPSAPSSSSSSSVPQTPSSANPFSSSLDPITEAPNVIVTNGTPPSEGPISARERSSSATGPISSVGAVLHSPKPLRPHEPNDILNGSRVRGGSLPGHPIPNIGLGKPPGSSKLTLQSDPVPDPKD
ncbi:hypothetical protein FRC00_007117, partial [Tulasnella sp. 408]